MAGLDGGNAPGDLRSKLAVCSACRGNGWLPRTARCWNGSATVIKPGHASGRTRTPGTKYWPKRAGRFINRAALGGWMATCCAACLSTCWRPAKDELAHLLGDLQYLDRLTDENEFLFWEAWGRAEEAGLRVEQVYAGSCLIRKTTRRNWSSGWPGFCRISARGRWPGRCMNI